MSCRNLIFLAIALLLLSCSKEDNGLEIEYPEADIPVEVKKRLDFKEESIYVDYMSQVILVELNHNVAYDVFIECESEEWLVREERSVNDSPVMRPVARQLSFRIEKNTTEEQREALVIISDKSNELSDTLIIIQGPYEGMWEVTDDLVDGQAVILQMAGERYPNIVIMGDGFTEEHLLAGGLYETSVKAVVEHYFSIEPFTTYRDCFNVYMVVAESKTDKIGEKSALGLSRSKTCFETAFGSGTEIVCNEEKVFRYADKISEYSEKNPTLVIVVLNSDKYAGTCYLYQEGKAIALCPMSTRETPYDFESLVHHEAGGHGFGFLADEYVYYQSDMPESRIREIREWQKLGFQMNLDFTDDCTEILWKDFVGLEGYEEVGAFEGGYEYQYGVWRSEQNSCMNNNIPYFNVQSRWVIYKRIMELSGLPYSVEDFIYNDRTERPVEVSTRSIGGEFIPLGSPKWILE